MSQTSSSFTDAQLQQHARKPGENYTLTEEESRILKECNRESFWYRSVPFTAVGVTATHFLVQRGHLTASPRFGSLPKCAFAILCGFVLGKLSYAKECQEKLKRLENSPLGEALRQRQLHLPRGVAPKARSELGDPNTSASDVIMQPMDSYNADYHPAPYSEAPSSESSPQIPSDPDDDRPKKKSIMYEDLRNKNRENYGVMAPQKEAAPPAVQAVPQKMVKKNQYGDEWEE